jgi:MOSC domain-containing protein YiiM
MTFHQDSPLNQLLANLPQQGKLSWIGLRPARDVPMQAVTEAVAEPGVGLIGDRFCGTTNSKRQVTLMQAEHLTAVASTLHQVAIQPMLLRRNLVIDGINLLALKDQRFQIGQVVLQMTGLCHPCSKMEKVLGPGGYNALRGHGGITARVLVAGRMKIGDSVSIHC